jgi:hypothetical protein
VGLKIDRPPILGIGLTECGDGSFCCDLNNQTCCDSGQGVFLDSDGDVKPRNSSSPSMTTLVKVTTTSSSHITTASAPVTTSGLSTGQTIGIGIGVPLGIMVISALGVLLYYQQKRLRILEAAAKGASTTAVGEWSGVEEKAAGWLSRMRLSEFRSSRTSRNLKALPELPIRCPQAVAELPAEVPSDRSFYWESK